MHPYNYVNSIGSGQLYNHQISVPPLYSQPPIPIYKRVIGRRAPMSGSDQVYQAQRMTPVEIEVYDQTNPPFSWISSTDQMDVAVKVPFSGGMSPTSHGHKEASVPLVDYVEWESQEPSDNWPMLSPSPGLAPHGQFNPGTQQLKPIGGTSQGHYQSLAPSSNTKGFNPQNHPFPLTHPLNHAGLNTQGYPAGNKDFKSPNQPFPWAQPNQHAGMFAPENPAAIPFGFGASGKHANLGGLGNPAGWAGQTNPMGWGVPGSLMGWGNNGGNGQTGIFGNLLKVGKNTMNGIGIISSLIGMGKFLF
jgi:hypothetical protein